MIHKILGRLSSVRSFVFAALALAAFAASAFDTPYLTFRSAASFSLSGTSSRWTGDGGYLEYATSNPTESGSWTTWTGSYTSAVQTDGQYYIYLRGKGIATFNPSGLSSATFSLSASQNVYCAGDIETLRGYDGDVPAMGANCYKYMFYNWTKLKSAPVLSATTLANNCYQSMFYFAGITNAPALPAETLADNCYKEMFSYCSYMTSAPVLPATTMTAHCYENMFSGCSQLVTPPALPATTLASSCYQNMFQNCTGLKSLPTLPATTTASSCYYNMFQGCSGLEVNTSGPGVEWSIPSEVGAGASLYNSSMFANTSGSFTGAPVAGTTYKVASALPAGVIYQVAGGGTLTPAFSGAFRSWNLSATVKNGTAPYTFELVSGTLPPGLEVSGSTLSGTPMTPGSYNFTLRVTDAASNVWNDAPYSLNILQKTIVPVTFVDAAGASITTNCIQLNTGIISWDEEWYVATGTLNYGTGGITVSGDANLVLADGASLTVMGASKKAGINVASGNSLTIFGQAEGTGSLTAFGYSSDGYSAGGAGIGGNDHENCGSITINGGNITANGGNYVGAGIGGGYYGNGGTVTINGGTITAIGGSWYGAGIGGGNNGNGGDVTINGGTVTATAGSSSAGSSSGATGIGKGGGYSNTKGTLTVGPAVSVKAGSTANPTTEIGRGGSITIGTQRYFYVETLSMTQVENSLASYAGESKEWNLAATIVGGVTPYTFSGTVPSGLTLNSNGTLSGAVAVAGSYPFTLTVTDGAEDSKNFTYTLTVTAPDPITAIQSISATVDKPTSISLAVTISGGVSPYTFALKSGSNAPDGFSLVDGVLSGTPAVLVDAYSFTVVVTDAIGTEQDITYTFSVVESSGFVDDDPEEPASGVTVDCRTADGMIHQRTCNQITDSASAVTWSDSWYYVTGNVTLSAGVTVNGKVSLILGDGATLTITTSTSGSAGIKVIVDGSVTNSLTIYGQSAGTGKLNVSGAYEGAGIGSTTVSNEQCGKVTIYGGDITATGGQYSAGIGGGGNYGKGGIVVINGGTVTATTSSSAAGIGGGWSGPGGDVVINGGSVTATGGSSSYAGIGGNSGKDQGSLKVGPNVVVKANTSTPLNDDHIREPNEDGYIDLTTVRRYYFAEKTGPVPLAQTTNAFVAHVGEAFNQALADTVSGGTSPYSFTLKTGTLPTGLSFENGTISGTPTATAVETVVFTVTDSGAPAQSEDFSYTITVTYPPKTITYKDGNDTINGLSPTEYAPGTATALAASATKTGYTFAGWYDNAECTGSAVTEVSDSETENKTYWAKWTPVAYSIVYMDGTTPMDGLTPTTYTIEAAATLPETATKAGYGFYGWYDNSGCTGDAVTTIPAGQTGTKTFYAKWGVIKTNETYIDGSGNEQTAECATITSSSTSLSTGWYIVKEDVTISQKVTVSGAVNLILADGATLTVNSSEYDPAVAVKGDDSLTIYAQENGTGAFSVTATSGPAIGARDASSHFGTLTVYGGNITANGSYSGIGGGYNTPGGAVYVYGGTVIANTSSSSSAGIGGYNAYKTSGTLTVGENIVVKAKVDDSYSSSFVLKERAGDGTITLAGEMHYKIFAPAMANVSYRDTDGTTKSKDCVLISDEMLDLAGGWYAVTSDLNFGTLGMSVSGSANLIIADGASLVVTGASYKAGINVPTGSSLAIYGQAGDTGVISAVGGGNYAAGIGGNRYESCGTVTINGGTIIANGSSYGAGIGGGNPGAGGTVTINGGNVTATGGNYGAGIGGGMGENNDPSLAAGGTVTINGGTVTAQGGSYAAGIGGGEYSNGGAVTVNGGSITAISGNTSASGIGKGAFGTGTVNGTLTVSSSMSVMAGANAGSATKRDRDEMTGAITLSGQQYFFIERVGPAGLVQTMDAFAAQVGVAFNQALSATVSGGTSPYTFTQKSGTLSAGLSFENGTISGAPTTAGSATVVFTVTDSGIGEDNQSEDFSYTITVTYPPKSITYIDSRDGTTELTGLVPAQYMPGTAATLPNTASAPNGYEFAGWYATSECTGEAITTVSASETENKTFYAKWTPIVYTVTYMTDSTTPIADQGLEPTSYTIESATQTLPASATKAGKGFYGWYDNAGCTGDAVTTIPQGSTGDKVFYAKWGAEQSNEVYVDAGGNEMPAQLCTVIASDTTTLATGWYVAKGEVTISESVTVSGDVNLILADGAHLEVTVASGYKSGLNVASGNSLTIYAQANGTGRLDATGASSISSGIGGNSGQVCGSVTINGGTVTATGGTGIGSGYDIGSDVGGTVIINGGRVSATGASGSAAGIGSVKSTDNQGTLTVGANVVVKAGASSTLTDSDIKNPNGETSISLTTIYQYYRVEKVGPSPLTQETSAFAAQIGVAFEQSITGTISGGTAPYTFTLKSQTLSEKGLSYSDGAISGTPNATGSATVTVTVSDSATGADHQSADFTYTVTVTYPPKSITYVDSRDGTTELTGLEPTQYTPETATALPLTATAPNGYAFDGWYTNAACTGDAVATISTSETEDKTFYAKWTPILYTITYRDGASTMSGLEPTTYTIESADITLPTTATKEGYEFVSWHTLYTLSTESVVTTIPHGSTGNRTFHSKWIAAKSNESYIDADGNPQTELASPLDSTTTSLETGWYIVKGNVAINSTVTVTGDVKLILADGCSLTVNGTATSGTYKAGINVAAGNSLTIYAQENGTGSLTATGGNNGAGIGGNESQTCGSVTIYGGNITARSLSTSSYGAGIGGGKDGAGGTVTMYGGTVVAQVQLSTGRGAGIGGGGSLTAGASNGGTVTIYGGTVTATATNNGAGIGGGSYGNGGTVTIYGGTVTATSSYGGAGIGGGYYGAGGNVTINGGTVTATAGSITSSTTGYIPSGIGKGYGAVNSYGYGTLTVGANMKAYVGTSANPTTELGTNKSYRYYVVKAAPLAQSLSALEAGAGEECNIDLAATVSGGTGTYSFAVKDGSSLPDGLAISGTTLSGTVGAVGEYTFTLVVTDTTEPTPQTMDAEYTLTAKLPGFIDDDPVQPTSDDAVSVDCRNADGVVRKRMCHPVTSSDAAVTWDNSWYYVTGNVTLSAGVTVVGKVSLVLADDATLTVTQSTANNAGINVSVDNSLVIYGQTNGNGALNASASTAASAYGAGIGGNRGASGNTTGKCGTIIIYGGSITAQGSYYGAGIGGGYYGAGGTIDIYGGTVNATGGYYGSGIGGGYYAAGGTVNVYGGAFEATAGSANYAIGVGRGGGSSSYLSGNFCVFNEDMTVKAGSSATASLTKLTPNATTHKVTVSTYKYFIVTGPLPMSQRTASLGTARTGELKSWTLATSTSTSYIQDGKPPYTFDPENSTIPEGFSLTSAGVLSGRPSSAGNYEFDIAVADSNPSSTNFTFTLTVSDPNPITMSTGLDLGTRTKGQSYTKTLSASGGVPSLTYAVVDGTFPPGLNLGTGGYISGSTTTAGDYNFTVRVTDSALPANTADFEFHMFVKDVYSITYYDGENTLSLNPATYVQDAGVATLPTPVKEGYAFLSWHDNAGLYGAPVTSIPSTSTGPVELYSKWYVPVTGDIEVTFNGADGEQTETCTVITPSMAVYDSTIHYNNTSSNITLSSGWYVVANIDTLPEKVSIVINGEVNIVLMDDRSLTVTKPAYHKTSHYISPILLTAGNTLNIYGQSKGNGTLSATGYSSTPGIGGCYVTNMRDCGTLKVYGGTVIATGASGAAGIGGFAGSAALNSAGDGGTVEIYGGTVTATGSRGGAGIGGGDNYAGGYAGCGGTVKIYGGTVTAIGSGDSDRAGAGIGGGGSNGSYANIDDHGGRGGTVEIYNGNVTAIGGAINDVHAAGIGAGSGSDDEGTLKVSGEYALVYAGANAESKTERTPDANDMVELDGSPYFEIQGEGAAPVTCNITYMSAGESQYWLEPNNYTQGTAQTLAEAPDPREGYTFAGWYEDDQFTGEPVVEVPASATGDKTFYAKWTAVAYTITYYNQVGDEKIEITGLEPATYTTESGATLPTEISVVREGWVFDGWCSYVSGPQITQIAADTIGDKTFYARWDVADFGLFDGELDSPDAGEAGEWDLTDTIHKGTAPYTFALKEGSSLPDGLVLDADGTLHGTATAAGNYTFTLTVTDSSEPQKTIDAVYTMDVYFHKSTSSIYGEDARIPVGYQAIVNLQAAISGGTAPYTFEVVEETPLTPGLRLQGNYLRGTPTVTGNSHFFLKVTDANALSFYLYYWVYVYGDFISSTSMLRHTTVNGVEWTHVSATDSGSKSSRMTLWNDWQSAIPTNTAGQVFVPYKFSGGSYPPSYVCCVGAGAFSNCTELVRVTLPPYLEAIGENAFFGCSSLKEVAMLAPVEQIDAGAFAGTALETVYVRVGDADDIRSLLAASGCNTDGIAIVECEPCTLTLDPNLGTLDQNEFTVPANATVGGLPVPVRENYAFEGWFTAREGGDEVAEDTVISGDTTYYARWTSTLPPPEFTVNDAGELTAVNLNGNTEITLPDTVRSITTGLREKANILRVTIPNSVTNIASRAFYQCHGLTEIVIPGSVEYIGTNAFYQCTNMVSLTIGDGVRIIDQYAFSYCTSLDNGGETLYIPDSVETIGLYAFNNIALDSVSLPGALYSEGAPLNAYFVHKSTGVKSTTVTYRTDQPVFRMYGTRLTSVQLNGNTEVTIPSSVTDIGSAFQDLGELVGVTIPSSVTNIGVFAFQNCTNLTSITIPSSVVVIGGSAFQGCTSLEEIEIPDSVVSMEHAFWDCSGLTRVVLGNGLTEIAPYTFMDCTSLTNVVFGENLSVIGNTAFEGCTALTDVVFPDSLTRINYYAFRDCTSITELVIPENVVVDFDAFRGCTSLTDLTVKSGVTLSYASFQDCTSLSQATLEDRVTVESHVFNGCSKLANVTIGKGAVLVQFAFSGCSGLKSVNISGTVVSPKKRLLAAAGGRRLLAAAEPDPDATSVGDYAFYGCSGLETALIGSKVNEIGGGAFGGCTKLRSITVEAGNTSYETVEGMLLTADRTKLISGAGDDKGVTVPEGVTEIEEGAFAGFGNITSVTLPNTVTTIGKAAFSNCTALATVTIPSSVTSIGSKAFYDTAIKTVCVSSGDGTRMSGLVAGTGYNTEGVTFFDLAAAVPSVDKPLEEASNGIPNWQNYVLGQDGDEPVKVEGVSTATESSVTIASTLKTPTASTGFTVKYSIDQVSADGAVVSEGEKQTSSALSIDLESITTNAFFTMKATIVNDATGAEVPVTTENVIGVMVVTNAPATTIIGVPFKSLADDGSISVSNLVQTANLSEGDELKAFDADGKLHSWTLTDGAWVPDYVSGGTGTEMSEDADKIKLARGKGVWLTRKDPTKPIYFVGEASVEAAETELDVATDEAPKAWNMVAPPSVEPVKLNDVFTVDDGSTIQVPPARDGGIPRNYTFKNGKWGYDGSEDGIPKRIESDTLPPGRGFWYINKSKDPNKKINW